MEVHKVTDTLRSLGAPLRAPEEVGSFPKDASGASQRVPEKSPEGGEGEGLSEAQLLNLVEKMNTIMEALAVEARFSIHEATHTVMVTLVNRETGEVIRQIPPEKLLDMVARFRELAGLFVDEVV